VHVTHFLGLEVITNGHIHMTHSTQHRFTQHSIPFVCDEHFNGSRDVALVLKLCLLICLLFLEMLKQHVSIFSFFNSPINFVCLCEVF